MSIDDRPRPDAVVADPTNVIVAHDLTRIHHLGDGKRASKTDEEKSLDVRALDSVSLVIKRGELVAIMGASGSGKSTLMNILGCLDRPTSGRYFLDGEDVSTMNRDELADIRSKRIGFVFQSFNLLPRTTALENVELPLLYAGVGSAERTRRATAALGRVGLADRILHRPSELSGGQQQRVALARAIVNEPKIVLADEPTGNLDSKTSDAVMRLFQDLWRSGLTIVFVTHEPDVARYASRILYMRDGKIVSDTQQVAYEPARAA